MGMFGNLKTEGLEEAQDRLGGYSVKPTDAYEGVVKVAYAGAANSGAQYITLVLALESGEYTETIYITNKKGENFFLNKNDETKKVPLPGFTLIDDLCLVTTDKPLSEQDTEDKVVKVYDPGEKKEIPKTVPVLVELLGKKAFFGIVAQTVNKQEKDNNDVYQPVADTRDENVTEKVFHHPTMLTVVEVKQGIKEPAFYGAWLEKNKGKTRDKRTIKDGAASGVKSGRPGSGGAPQAGGTEQKKTSLFGGK